MTQIRIKRSLEAAAPGSLANGELAWTSNGNILYIGANDAIEPIGGKRFPGVLTANQALVANSTGMLNVVRLGNSTVNAIVNGTAFSLANSTVSISITLPTAAQVSGAYYLKADGTYAEVAAPSEASAAGSNTQIQFNDSTSFGATAGLTFNKDSNTVTVGNAVSAAVLAAGANVTVNTTVFHVGNSVANAFMQYNTIRTSNSSGLISITPTNVIVGATTANAVINSTIIQISNPSISTNVAAGFIFVGSNAAINSSALQIGNTANYSRTNSTIYQVYTAAGNTNVGALLIEVGANVAVNATSFFVGNSTVNAVTNSSALAIRNATITSTFQPGSLSLGSNVTLTTSTLNIGNSTVNTVANSTLLSLSTASSIANLSATSLTIGSSVINSTSIAVQDAVISGNLVINGELTTIDTTNLVVEDAIIKLARNNSSSDTLDIGFYGLCDPSGSQDTYTGLFRDASDAKWKLFELSQTEPTTTVDTGATGYALATLVCGLESDDVNITGGVIDAGVF